MTLLAFALATPAFAQSYDTDPGVRITITDGTYNVGVLHIGACPTCRGADTATRDLAVDGPIVLDAGATVWIEPYSRVGARGWLVAAASIRSATSTPVAFVTPDDGTVTITPGNGLGGPDTDLHVRGALLQRPSRGTNADLVSYGDPIGWIVDPTASWVAHRDVSYTDPTGWHPSDSLSLAEPTGWIPSDALAYIDPLGWMPYLGWIWLPAPEAMSAPATIATIR